MSNTVVCANRRSRGTSTSRFIPEMKGVQHAKRGCKAKTRISNLLEAIAAHEKMQRDLTERAFLLPVRAAFRLLSALDYQSIA